MRSLKVGPFVLTVAAAVVATAMLSGCCSLSEVFPPVPLDPKAKTEQQSPPVPMPPADEPDVAFNQAEEITIFKNSNDGVVRAGSTVPVTFKLDARATISYIQTYHWDSGKQPGEISLKGEDGTVYGPWEAVGTVGQGGMPNAYWEVKPNQSLAPGTYTVIDSDPSSWSTNGQMGGLGQTIVRGYVD
jgi:hypothetical protein